VNVVYAFGFDKLFFSAEFMPLQIIGLFIVLGCNVAVVLFKIVDEKKQ